MRASLMTFAYLFDHLVGAAEQRKDCPNQTFRTALAEGGNSPVAHDCVVELVGLEPTTRVLWNAGVSDQLTLSDTRHSSSKRAAIDGNFYNREIFSCRHAGMESPGVPRTTA